MDGSHQVRPVLTADEARALLASGVASGGMQAKLNAALAALEAGIAEVRIAPGGTEGVLMRILQGEALGTRLAPVEVPIL
jgi:acetylglutamate kinase